MKRVGGRNLPQLRELYSVGAIAGLTDGQLLERFTTASGESAELAFAALVERHGAMVLGVCRAILRDEHSASDAFQATFVVLLRKARSLWVKDSLGPWLYNVAHRASEKARTAAARRRFHEKRAAERQDAEFSSELGQDDVAGVVYAELARLPEHYRTPIVLCDLEGRTHEEASRHIGCAIGTVKSRLSRGRERLRTRLARRGFGPACSVASAISAARARADVLEPPFSQLLGLAKRSTLRNAAERTIPASVERLARGVLLTMLRTKIAAGVAVVIAIGSVALGTKVLALKPLAQEPLPAARAKHSMTIYTVDQSGKPIEGTRIFRNYSYLPDGANRPTVENKNYSTDAAGKAIVALPGRSNDLRLWATKDGFVPLHAMWAAQFQSDGDQVPDEFTFRLDRGTAIGGIVVDEDGKPVKGVRVEVRDNTAMDFHLVKTPKGPGIRPVRSYSLADGADAPLTDEQGRWKVDVVPPDRDLVLTPQPFDGRFGPPEIPSRIELHLVHSGYVSDERAWGDLQREQGVTHASLRDQSAKIVLQRKRPAGSATIKD